MLNKIHSRHIGNTYHQTASHGRIGKPDLQNTKALSRLPIDQVTLSKEALKNNNDHLLGDVDKHQDLNTTEKQLVNDLKKRDAEVKAHEAAHMAAGGGIVQGSATYEYQTGPDGKMYAVGGEVQIDVSSEGTPEATIRKMQQVRAAALAPSDPSATDRTVAAQASQIEAQSRMKKAQMGNDDQNIENFSSVSSGNKFAEPIKSFGEVHIDLFV